MPDDTEDKGPDEKTSRASNNRTLSRGNILQKTDGDVAGG
jgi:hypothetical protein